MLCLTACPARRNALQRKKVGAIKEVSGILLVDADILHRVRCVRGLWDDVPGWRGIGGSDSLNTMFISNVFVSLFLYDYIIAHLSDWSWVSQTL